MISLRLDALLLSLRPASAVRVVTPASDRAAWSLVPSPRLTGAVSRAEKALSVPVRAGLLGECLSCEDGRSDEFARNWFIRRELIKALSLGVCLGGADRYAARLADLVWSVCEESGWTFPGKGASAAYRLSDVDMYAAETAALLATAAALCRDALDAVSPEVARRVAWEARRRVLEPMAAVERLDWLRGSGIERAVCAVMTTVLLLEEDGERRWLFLRKALKLLEAYLRADRRAGLLPLESTLPDLMALSDVAVMLKELSGGEVDLTNDEELKRMAQIPCAMFMGNGWFVNPGYASMRPAVRPEALYRLGKGTSSGDLRRLAAYIMRNGPAAGASIPFDVPTETLYQQAGFLLDADAFSRESARAPLSPAVFLEEKGFMAARAGDFACAMHAGSTEHADAGDVALFYRGDPVLIDLGETSRADWHNVPVVNGVSQEKGALAGEADCRFDRNYTVLSLALAPAYVKRAGLLSWQRTAMLSPYEGDVRLMDVFDFDGRPGRASFRFVTPMEPVVGNGGAKLGPVSVTWDGGALDCRVDRVSPRSASARFAFGENVFRLTLDMRSDAPGGSFAFRFSPA